MTQPDIAVEAEDTANPARFVSVIEMACHLDSGTADRTHTILFVDEGLLFNESDSISFEQVSTRLAAAPHAFCLNLMVLRIPRLLVLRSTFLTMSLKTIPLTRVPPELT